MTESGNLDALVLDALHLVIDPELGFNIVDLGLIYGVEIEDSGRARITMTTTTPGCPATGYLVHGAAEAARSVPGVQQADVQLTYDPLWSTEKMSALAKQHFGVNP